VLGLDLGVGESFTAHCWQGSLWIGCRLLAYNTGRINNNNDDKLIIVVIMTVLNVAWMCWDCGMQVLLTILPTCSAGGSVAI